MTYSIYLGIGIVFCCIQKIVIKRVYFTMGIRVCALNIKNFYTNCVTKYIPPKYSFLSFHILCSHYQSPRRKFLCNSKKMSLNKAHMDDDDDCLYRGAVNFAFIQAVVQTCFIIQYRQHTIYDSQWGFVLRQTVFASEPKG